MNVVTDDSIQDIAAMVVQTTTSGIVQDFMPLRAMMEGKIFIVWDKSSAQALPTVCVSGMQGEQVPG